MTKEELQQNWRDADKALAVITNKYYAKRLEEIVCDAFCDAMRDLGVPEDEIFR